MLNPSDLQDQDDVNLDEGDQAEWCTGTPSFHGHGTYDGI
jgi:hypothetical protein